jgi:hypothetical protein
MKQNKVAHVEYTRATNLGSGKEGEVSDRYIIPTFIPQDNIKALDVTELTEDQRNEMQDLWEQYQAYYTAAVTALFDFETWVEHSTNKKVTPKWRTFKKGNIKLLD